MSVTQIMQGIEALTPEDRFRIQAFLIHLQRKDDPKYRMELARRIDEAKAGRGATREDLLKIMESDRDSDRE